MLIAHRGDTLREPANTIAAFEAAHSLGACAIHTEIQFSADGTPWCHQHDCLDAGAGAGNEVAIGRLPDRDLRGRALNTLDEVVDWASRHRHLDWFVEIDQTQLETLGVEYAVGRVARLIRPESDSFAVLSRDIRSLRVARNLGCHQVALKVDSVAQCLSVGVLTLAPDYLLIRDSHVDCPELPPGPWQWVVYEINSAEEAVRWRRRGAHHILTGNLSLLMRSREASDVYGF